MKITMDYYKSGEIIFDVEVSSWTAVYTSLMIYNQSRESSEFVVVTARKGNELLKTMTIEKSKNGMWAV